MAGGGWVMTELSRAIAEALGELVVVLMLLAAITFALVALAVVWP